MSSSQRDIAAEFENAPLSRSEYIATMVHFYRGEVDRSNVWRQRLDNTTNWAVVTTAAIVTFSFAEPSRTHMMLLLSNFIVLGFLFIEARRFRYFSVYRARVRMLEENFILPIVTRNLMSPKQDWREFVAMDLDVPKFKNTLTEALALRIRYNYYWIFSTLALAWLIKAWMHPEPAASFADFYEHVMVGYLPGWLLIGIGVVFFATVTGLFFWAGYKESIKEDEIHGYETQRSHWKF